MKFERNITIVQGKDWTMTLRFADKTRVYRQIAAASNSAPMQITAPDHGLPEGWPYWVRGAEGAKALNNEKPWRARVVDLDRLEINALNGALSPPYLANSGWLHYLRPVSLEGRTARMQIRDDFDSPQARLTLTDAAGIVIDDLAKTITLTITEEQAAGLVLPDLGGVWDAEFPGADGAVDLYVRGAVYLKREVART